MEFLSRSFSLVALLTVTGCTSTLHDWGGYSSELYQYYKSPTQEQQVALQSELFTIFERAEAKGIAPPPGLYAEYGTLLLENGDSNGAIEYFQKEKTVWPESGKLMDALIAALNQMPQEEDTGASQSE